MIFRGKTRKGGILMDTTLSEKQVWEYILALKNDEISFEELKMQLPAETYNRLEKSFILDDNPIVWSS